MAKRTTSIQFSEQALENVEVVKTRYGLSTLTAAVNLALQETARQVKREQAELLTGRTVDASVES